MMLAKILLVCLLGVVRTQDYSYYYFNNGNCPNNDCCTGLTCSCDTDVVQDLVASYAPPAVPAPVAATGAISGVTTPQSIGWGPDSPDAPVSSAERCDHAINVTVVQQAPFEHDGDIKYCEWYVGPDCQDDAPQAIGKENQLIRFGLFQKDGSDKCSYKMLGYVVVPRSQYYDSMIKAGGTPGTARFDFTSTDLSSMGIKDQHIKGLYIGFSYSFGGGIAYQTWNANFATTSTNSVCIYDTAAEFEDWTLYDTTAKPTRSLVLPLKQRQENRRYSVHCVYQPL